jgi:hypothetical protein
MRRIDRGHNSPPEGLVTSTSTIFPASIADAGTSPKQLEKLGRLNAAVAGDDPAIVADQLPPPCLRTTYTRIKMMNACLKEPPSFSFDSLQRPELSLLKHKKFPPILTGKRH